MPTVWEAARDMGYEESREAEVIFASPDKKGQWHHAPLHRIAERNVEDIGTLYVASGRFVPGSVGRFRGRLQANLYDIIDLPFDFDLKTYTGRTESEIWDQDYEETEREIEALAGDVLEAMSAIRLPPFTITNTGYGVLARVRVASPFRTRVADLRSLQSHYIESINRFYGSGFCDKQVGDAGTRITRVVGSYNEKADVPRKVTLLYQGDELFDPTGIPIIRKPERHEPIPEEHPLSEEYKTQLIEAFSSMWKDGYRHQTALGAAGMMAKSGVPEREALMIIREASDVDTEQKDRERAVHTTYDAVRSGRPVAGYSLLVEQGVEEWGQSLASTILRDHALAASRRLITERSGTVVGAGLPVGNSSVHVSDTLSRHAVDEDSGDVSHQSFLRSADRGDGGNDTVPASSRTGWWADYLDYVAPTTSSPDLYHLASILTVTGAMVGRRIGAYLGDNQWPILHTVLVGETGLTKKDTAMNRALGTMTYSPNGSFHNMFQVLSGVGSAEALADQLQQSNVLLRLSELSGFLHKARQPSTANLRPMITELWNCGPEYSLITRGNPIRISNPTMALLGAIPPETLQREMGSEDIQSGFANRLLFVYGTGKEAIARPPQPNWASLGDLAGEMRELILSYAPGTILEFDRDAGAMYDEWFYDFVQIQYLTELERQMAQRVPAYVVRIALLYAISYGADAIGVGHTEAARDLVVHLFNRAAPETRSWGANDEARLASGIISFVTGEGRPRSDIDRAFSAVYGPSVVGRAIEALRNNGRIEQDAIGFVTLNTGIGAT
jgi:hypothetical protein